MADCIVSWKGIRASLVFRNHDASLIAATPVSYVVCTGVWVFLAAVGLVLFEVWNAPEYRLIGFIVGGIVASGGRLAWRLYSPVIRIDGRNNKISVARLDRSVNFDQIEHVLLMSGQDVRGYRQAVLSLVTIEGERIPLFQRNNFDNDPFQFHGEFTEAQMTQLSQKIAGLINKHFRTEEHRERYILDGEPRPVNQREEPS